MARKSKYQIALETRIEELERDEFVWRQQVEVCEAKAAECAEGARIVAATRRELEAILGNVGGNTQDQEATILLENPPYLLEHPPIGEEGNTQDQEEDPS